MPDIIHLLSDAVANQIAAGEVIQRPASAVKELLENAIDSGADEIKLIIKDAGRSLIQVIDNGCGMSETDARLCFERHATSKINSASDLFAIRTMGFRGEALASIAAIAQVELKTRRHEDELGTQIIIEGTRFISQAPCSSPTGTTFTIKNLFFNTPARRNFLKSEITEFNHILDEFYRIALVNKNIQFLFLNNNKEVFHLPKSRLKERITNLFGNQYNEKLVSIEQETDLIKISGFIGKPEFARKTRGEQYFFVNGRFIRHPYFHHAIDSAYRELIAEQHFPAYFVFFQVDPAAIDVNIHPTKTEVKFLDEKVLYSIIHSAVRLSLGKFNLTPSIDFDTEPGLELGSRPSPGEVRQPQIAVNSEFNPFHKSKNPVSDPLLNNRIRSNQANWEQLYAEVREHLDETSVQSTIPEAVPAEVIEDEKLLDFEEQRTVYQLKNRYLIASIKSGLMLIDQQRAHERILYEKMLYTLDQESNHSQQELFPHEIILSKQDAALIAEMNDNLHNLGFVFETSIYHENAFMITGVPADLAETNPVSMIEELIENYKNNDWKDISKKTRLAFALAKSLAVKPGKMLQVEEMNNLIDGLFSSVVPEQTPDGKKIITIISMEEIQERFK